MAKAILILSHQLLSMVEPIKHIAEKSGYTCFILSSASERIEKPQWSFDKYSVHVTNSLHLIHADIDQFLTDYGQGIDFVGCISVWDGYRELMAYANQKLGANDISEDVVVRLRDKLAMRTRLREAGLSAVSCQLLNEDIYQSITTPENYFIKPRTGLASMGTFPAKSLTAYSQLDALWASAAADRNYDGVFSADNGFIIEGFISGTECSFEVSVSDGQSDVLAVHEKLDVVQDTWSVLEGACICPPRSLNAEQTEAGKAFLGKVMQTLGVHTGVYHVEMKCDARNRWEIIEINPRIGGAYIVDSTRVHSGACLLETWLRLITGKPAQRGSRHERTTFFRVFFGQSGRTLQRIERNVTEPQVLLDKVLYKPGDRLPRVEREIFLGMALWDITEMAASQQPDFFNQTNDYLKTEYQP
ncbi:ATP-grasp domain-containing protein [Rahnella woolbedingensis]|uniref:ATP-grasp domain-containing protein n=1 Tax=Rahnella woolbedingensis TaxID=1510574 RepID=A0A419N9A9_9GAMM|nr:ATP-grasp domain-containing protein [Rahnella woolbedingensis]RJT44354.1 ATP-grasp domain-containing protein [Rahnella woolbedingensis]